MLITVIVWGKKKEKENAHCDMLMIGYVIWKIWNKVDYLLSETMSEHARGENADFNRTTQNMQNYLGLTPFSKQQTDR